MKTPREILLAQHRAAGPKLDAIRRAVVEKLNNQATKEQSWAQSFVSWLLRCSNIFWRELILPSRRTWATLVAVWMVIFAINVAQRNTASAVNASAAPVMMSFGEQQRMLNELFADRAPVSDADQPKTIAPQPHTELLLLRTV